MKNHEKLSRIIILCFIAISCISCNKTTDKTERQDINGHTINLNTTQSISQLRNKAAKEMKATDEKVPQYHYYIRKSWHLGKLSHLYGIDGADEQNYPVPVLYIEIPNDKEKETRINKMLIERYVTLLPDDTDEEWWEKQEIHITYRSEQYLCFRYLSNVALPEECSDRNLYFTLDLENESIIEYPLVEEQTGKFEPDESGNLYKELEAYQEKTVEEQSALRGNTEYQVCQAMTECEGISFPCVKIEGLADKKKQEQINLALQVPLKVLIEDGVWEDKENQQRIFDSTKIYIAYQTEQWLSVVYSLQIPIDPDPRWRDGVKDFGITIHMQDGKRVLLDDLFEKDKILDWFYAMGMYEEGNKQYGGEKYEGLGLLLQTEKEKATEFKDNVQKNNIVKLDEKCWLLGMTDWDSFYLYKGKLAILRMDSFYDFEIPLPEIYEYLKVEPWY